MSLPAGVRSSTTSTGFDGVWLSWSASGQGSKAVILLHGWACDRTVWQAQIPALAEHYRVAAPDLPGHGGSGLPKDGRLSVDLFARSVEVVRRELGAERAVLVGHSMGSAVALRYARLHPGRVAAFVFVEGIVAPRRVPALDPKRLAAPHGKQVLERIIRSQLFVPATPEAVRRRVLTTMLATPAATTVGVVHAMRDASVWSDEVVDLPVLGVYRRRSWVVNRKALERRCPALEYVEIPDAGHFLMMEKWQEFNRLLLAFLAGQRF